MLPLDWESIIPWANRFYGEEYIKWAVFQRRRGQKKFYKPVVMKRCSLNDEELQLIRRLSQDYASEYAEASDPARACPIEIDMADISEDAALANANAMADAFMSMFGKQDDVTSVEEVRNQ